MLITDRGHMQDQLMMHVQCARGSKQHMKGVGVCTAIEVRRAELLSYTLIECHFSPSMCNYARPQKQRLIES